MPVRLCLLNFLSGCVLTMCAAFAGPAKATVVTDGVWYEFAVDGVGSSATGCNPADPAGPFCISSSGTPTEFAPAPAWGIALLNGGTLTVTDAFLNGDIFDIFDFGVLIGSTSPIGGAADCGDDPVVCLADAGMSSGLFALGTGAHSLTIVAAQAPSSSAVGYFRIDPLAAVPEPSTIGLLGSVVGFALWCRSRRAVR